MIGSQDFPQIDQAQQFAHQDTAFELLLQAKIFSRPGCELRRAAERLATQELSRVVKRQLIQSLQCLNKGLIVGTISTQADSIFLSCKIVIVTGVTHQAVDLIVVCIFFCGTVGQIQDFPLAHWTDANLFRVGPAMCCNDGVIFLEAALLDTSIIQGENFIARLRLL